MITLALAGLGASAAANADAQRLVRGCMPFAARMLRAHGRFFPFGAALTCDDELTPVLAHEGDPEPAATGLIERLRQAHRGAAAAARCKATATVYAVTLTGDAPGESSDAVALEIDHAEGLSAVVFLIYRFEDGSVALTGSFVQEGAAGIFARADTE